MNWTLSIAFFRTGKLRLSISWRLSKSTRTIRTKESRVYDERPSPGFRSTVARRRSQQSSRPVGGGPGPTRVLQRQLPYLSAHLSIFTATSSREAGGITPDHRHFAG